MLKSLAGALIGSTIGKRSNNSGLMGAGIGLVATRLATRSIPGALLVGGGFLAKKMFDRYRERNLGVARSYPPVAPANQEVPQQPVTVIQPDGTPVHKPAVESIRV